MKDPDALRRATAGMDAFVNVVNMLAAPIPQMLDIARVAAIRRVIFFGTTAIFTSLSSRLRARRIEAEASISDSGLQWAILRPTMIYGGVRDGNIARLIGYLSRGG